MLSKGLGLFGEAEKPNLGPQPLGREVLSLLHGSGLFLGQWDVGCVLLCEGQCYDTSWPPHWVVRRQQGPSVMSTACLLMSLCSRDNCPSQGDKALGSAGAFQPCQCSWSSPPQAVLRCPIPAHFSLQAVGTCLASPPCSNTCISLFSMMSVQWVARFW